MDRLSRGGRWLVGLLSLALSDKLTTIVRWILQALAAGHAMIAETATRTLLEDWRTRRAELAAEMHDANDQATALLKVLDYLIRRYEGTEIATQPARAALPQATIVNTRAMIVHHHLWSGVVAGVKNRFEAQQRISGVLRRMGDSTSPESAHDHSAEPGSKNPFAEPENYPYRTKDQWDGTIKWAFWFGVGRLWAIRGSLGYSPFLPQYAIEYLAQGPGLTGDQHVAAVNLLAWCASRSVFETAAEALEDRLVTTGRDAVTETLVELLREPTVQELYYPKTVKAATARLRERLAAEDPDIRRRAIRVLALLGDLSDISLLADLAAISDVDDSFPEERAEILAAMEEISHRPDS